MGHSLTPRSSPEATTVPPRPVSRRGLALDAGVALLALGLVALVTILGAMTGTAPADAVDRHPDGTVTVTVRRLSGSAIDDLNARLHRMGVDETVIPVTRSCHARHVSFARAPSNSARAFIVPSSTGPAATVTFDPRLGRQLWPRDRGVVIAERLQDGRVSLRLGGVRPPVPSCSPPAAER